MTLVDFLIVGTSRSGTTLAQRLAAELPGVAIPQETHFFPRILPRLQRFGPIAMAPADTIQSVLAREHFRQPVDVSRLDLSSPLALFETLVRDLAHDGATYGEKTPVHLRWWRPLMRARPKLKLIGIVRHPCAVLLSLRRVPWGAATSTEQFAATWRHDQRLLLKAAREQPTRMLIIRYEDMVRDPQASQERIAHHIGVESTARLQRVASEAMSREDEWWKSEVTSAISTEHADAWQTDLDRRSQVVITRACRREMQRLGYAVPRGLTTSPKTWYRLARTGLRLAAQQRKLDRQSLV